MRPRRQPQIASVVGDIARYLAGERVDFSAIPVDLGGVDDFRRSLYEALRAVGFGTTTTYGALAKRLGLEGPEAARDVGAAMGQNPVPIVIPCHRVLAAGGKLGGFSAPGGVCHQTKIIGARGRAFRRWRTAPARVLTRRAFFETQTFLDKCVAAVVNRGLIAATELRHSRLSERYRRLQ